MTSLYWIRALATILQPGFRGIFLSIAICLGDGKPLKRTGASWCIYMYAPESGVVLGSNDGFMTIPCQAVSKSKSKSKVVAWTNHGMLLTEYPETNWSQIWIKHILFDDFVFEIVVCKIVAIMCMGSLFIMQSSRLGLPSHHLASLYTTCYWNPMNTDDNPFASLALYAKI